MEADEDHEDFICEHQLRKRPAELVTTKRTQMKREYPQPMMTTNLIFREAKHEDHDLNKYTNIDSLPLRMNRRRTRLQVARLRSSKNLIVNKMKKTSAKPYSNYSCLGLTVIVISTTLFSALSSNVIAQHNEHDRNSGGQLVAHASHNMGTSHSIRDLSGPTSGKIQTLDVICGKNFMTVRAEFSGPFYGIVFSKGTYGQENCIYVKPNSGLTHAAFNVYYDQCGTKPDLLGKFYENTIVIQYGSDIIEAYDEAKRLRCEWFEAYEKPATFKPAIPVADLEVVEMNFQGDDIDCWMEIQEGTGPTSREVTKIVPVGQPMTIVVAINDYNSQFDMRVKSCVAHDGVQPPIALTDEFGCVLRPKMLTPFTKVRNPVGTKKATILSYSRFLAFKFPDSMTVQIQCTVEVCRHGCADACQRVASLAATTMQPELSLSAKWPASPNQASSVESHRLVSSPRPQMSRPQEDAVYNDYRPHQPASFHGADMSSSDDMSGSESHRSISVHQQQPLHPPVAAQPHQPQQHQQQVVHHQRRSQDQPASPLDGRVPQYLMPINNRRVALNNRPPVSIPTSLIQPQSSTTTTSTTTTSTTSTTTTTTSAPMDEINPSEDDQPNRSNDNSETQASSTTRTEDPMATSASSTEASNSGEPQESSLSTDSLHDGPSDQSALTDQTAEASEVKPSVQGGDELAQESSETAKQQPFSNEAFASGKPATSQSATSLKTVEVEIPGNDESQSSGVPQRNSFNSVRLSSGSLDSSASAAYDAMYESKQDKNKSPSLVESQVIQPRDQQSSSPTEKRDKNDEVGGYDTAASLLSASNADGRNRFGARASAKSSPQSSAQPGLSNHQVASVDEPSDGSSNIASGDQSAILMDRSDESSVDIAPTGKSSSSSESITDSGTVDESSSGRVKPVVGTDELATGPVHLEDRMGASAQSLEEALNKLQHQLPQSAALVGTNQPVEAVTDVKAMLKEEAPQEQAQMSPQIANPVPSSLVQPDERIDSRSDMRPSAAKYPISPEPNQPHPNVYGQAKVIPEPGSNVNTRGPMLSQASGVEGVRVSPPPNYSGTPVQQQHPQQIQQSQQQQPPQPQQQQQMHQQPQGPVAQITSIPMSFGYPQTQTLQQLSQQFAQFQQQQPTMTSTTAKPARSRFSLLAPHTAIQAVASRLLPKSAASQQQQQQIQLPQLAQQASQLFQNFKQLPQDQQQLLAATAKSSPLVNGFFKSNMQQQQPQLQQQTAPVNPSVASGLFARFRHNQQAQSHQNPFGNQPLIRSRRSAMMSSKGNKGTGELGLTKTFMVVTNMDLAFAPNLTNSDLPEILEGRRPSAKNDDDEVIYGVCMPIVSLTFVLTCAFWLFVFILSFCIYTWIKTRRQGSQFGDTKLGLNDN